MKNISELVIKTTPKTENMRNLIRALILACICFQSTLSLKYFYGDGSYFIGDVDDHGRPSGHGKFHNTSGALGKQPNFKPVDTRNFSKIS